MKLIIFGLCFLPLYSLNAMQKTITLPSPDTLNNRLSKIKKCNHFLSHSPLLNQLANQKMPLQLFLKTVDASIEDYKKNLATLHMTEIYQYVFAAQMMKPRIIEACLSKKHHTSQRFLQENEIIGKKVYLDPDILKTSLEKCQYRSIHTSLVKKLGDKNRYPTEVFMAVNNAVQSYIMRKKLYNALQISVTLMYTQTLTHLIFEHSPHAIKHLENQGLLEKTLIKKKIGLNLKTRII